MAQKNLSNHVSYTYQALRRGVAAIAFGLPIVLAFGGYVWKQLPLQNSMSAYYHANAGHGPMRDWFVGGLFAVGVILFVYQGYTRREDIALNLAGMFVCGVALVPMEWSESTTSDKFSWHGVLAVLFFLCIGYVCVFRASDTLPLILDLQKRARYRRWYKIIGTLMWLSPLGAFLLVSVFGVRDQLIFFVELFGVYAFAAFWALKGHEIGLTKADYKATKGELQHQETAGQTYIVQEALPQVELLGI